ncbi:unnamed protein product [Durusdinium trenchii]|uniref:TPM domain-containing protein n=3 Tax=Durusdinium trenchii TaxID=1381693 RepID=A0ABP0LW32_9DINO
MLRKQRVQLPIFVSHGKRWFSTIGPGYGLRRMLATERLQERSFLPGRVHDVVNPRPPSSDAWKSSARHLPTPTSRPCPPLVLCGWALWLGLLVLFLSSSFLVLAARLNSVLVFASVVVLAGLHPEVSSVSGFAAALMNFWGVGHPRLHTGLLVMLLVQQRCLEMRVGYGLARLLPTEKLQQIQQERMRLHLAANKPGQALCEGLEAILTVLSSSSLRKSEQVSRNRHGFGGGQTPIEEFLKKGFYEQDDTAERMQCPNYLPVGVVRSESDKQPRECTRCSVLPWARQASHEEICRLDVSNCSVLKPGERCWIRCREPYFEGEPVHVMCNNSEESGGGLAWDRKTPKCKMKCSASEGFRSAGWI